MKRYYLVERKNRFKMGDKYISLIEVNFSNIEEKNKFLELKEFMQKEALFGKIKFINKKIVGLHTAKYNACVTRYNETLGDYCFEDNFYKVD